MAFRLPKNLKGFFKKDGGGDSEPVYKNEDFGLEDDWDELEDRFQEKDDKIVMEEPEDDKKARRLKGKLIFGLAGIILVFLLFSVLSNALAPKNKEENKENAQFSKGSRITNPASDVPNNYAEMAKYQRELEARKAAEEALRNRDATEGKVVPPANVTPPNPPAAPSVPQQPGYVVQQGPVAAFENHYSSPLSFKLDGANQQQAAAGNISNYSPVTGAGSRVDLGSVFTLQAGTVIPATLLSGIDSRLTGDVVAQVRQDVYDSRTGRHLIFPQGSKLIGKLAKSKGRRVGVTFTRVILPDGSNVNLPEQNAADNAGYPGMKDKYDTHDADFWRGSFVGLVTALMADGIDEAMDNKNRYVYNSSNNNNEYIRSNVSDYMSKLSDRLTERASKTEEPNVRIRPGYQFNVFINQDLNVYQYLR
jgi:type IV secretory pathway VirB10-like protein